MTDESQATYLLRSSKSRITEYGPLALQYSEFQIMSITVFRNALLVIA
jgi:hypothetical protein